MIYFCLVVAHHHQLANINTWERDVWSCGLLVAVCSVAHLFPSHAPVEASLSNIFSDESAPTAALQSGPLLRDAPQKTEGENDMEINHTFLLDQNRGAQVRAARQAESITHYVRLLTFLPTGSSGNIGTRIVIDKMSLLIEKCPHFPTR